MDDLVFFYGDGEYRRGDVSYCGRILLSQHKIFLRKNNQDIADTFIPLEKIWKMRVGWRSVEICVILSPAVRYAVMIKGKRSFIRDLIKDVSAIRCFQKKMFGREWVDVDFLD